MFQREDNTYNDIRRKSLDKWLEEMENHEDVAVRCGIPLVRGYIEHLENNAKKLEESNELKKEYLKKLRRN